ncbi:hypothetical protein GGS21DRAFT_447659 [Xylaria nigripes]|nr:hypothetical protein GGS21DRAFT_447659 [Xylaria nigripes]
MVCTVRSSHRIVDQDSSGGDHTLVTTSCYTLHPNTALAHTGAHTPTYTHTHAFRLSLFPSLLFCLSQLTKVGYLSVPLPDLPTITSSDAAFSACNETHLTASPPGSSNPLIILPSTCLSVWPSTYSECMSLCLVFCVLTLFYYLAGQPYLPPTSTVRIRGSSLFRSVAAHVYPALNLITTFYFLYHLYHMYCLYHHHVLTP